MIVFRRVGCHQCIDKTGALHAGNRCMDKRNGICIMRACLWGLFISIVCFLPVLQASESSDRDTISRNLDLSSVGGRQMSVEEAIRLALVHNPDINIVQDRLSIVKEAFQKTDALFRPRLSFYTELSTGDAPSAYLFKTIDKRILPENTNFNDPGMFNNIENGFNISLNLYNGGKDSAAVRKAASDIRKARALADQTKNSIVSSVIRLFFSALKAGEYIDIARQSVETVEEQLRIMSVRFKGGGVLRSDLLSLEVRLADAKKDLTHSRNIHEATLSGLNVLLGRKPDTPLKLVAGCDCPIVFPGSYQEAVVIAMEKRPEIIKAKEALQQARLAVTTAEAGYLPRVDLNARWYLDSDNFKLNGGSNNYTAAVVMNWDLYTGQSTASDISMAGYGLNLARKNMTKTELAVFEDVKRAYLNHEDATGRLEVAAKSVEMADESLSLIKQRYEGGSESVSRYLETELARSRSRMNRVTAFYDEKIALSDIAVAMGILSQAWKE